MKHLLEKKKMILWGVIVIVESVQYTGQLERATTRLAEKNQRRVTGEDINQAASGNTN